MSLRRRFIVLIAVAGGAFAVMAPAASPELGRIQSAAPRYELAQGIFEVAAGDDAEMAMVRQQARLALVHLRARSAETR